MGSLQSWEIFKVLGDYVTEIKITALSPHLRIDNYGLITSPHYEEYWITCEEHRIPCLNECSSALLSLCQWVLSDLYRKLVPPGWTISLLLQMALELACISVSFSLQYSTVFISNSNCIFRIYCNWGMYMLSSKRLKKESKNIAFQSIALRPLRLQVTGQLDILTQHCRHQVRVMKLDY